MRSKYLLMAAGLLLASGMVSAGYLELYGTLEGTANFEGPTFYAVGGGDLFINERPEGAGEITTYDLSGKELEFFTSKDIEKNWYPVKLDMYVKAKHSGTTQGSLNLDFTYVNSTGEFSACEKEVQVNVQPEDEYDVYSTSCEGKVVGEVSNFYYNIVSSANFDGDLKTDGDTRVEVSSR